MGVEFDRTNVEQAIADVQAIVDNVRSHAGTQAAKIKAATDAALFLPASPLDNMPDFPDGTDDVPTTLLDLACWLTELDEWAGELIDAARGGIMRTDSMTNDLASMKEAYKVAAEHAKAAIITAGFLKVNVDGLEVPKLSVKGTGGNGGSKPSKYLSFGREFPNGTVRVLCPAQQKLSSYAYFYGVTVMELPEGSGTGKTKQGVPTKDLATYLVSNGLTDDPYKTPWEVVRNGITYFARVLDTDDADGDDDGDDADDGSDDDGSEGGDAS